MTNKEAVKYLKEAIDVINCQEKKIEILKDYSKDLIAEISNLKNSAVISNVMESQRIKREIKAEAYKEFAYRLKQKSEYYENGQGWEGKICYEDDIDNLVKEMVGEE